MKQETLEEAAEKEFPLIDTEWCKTGAAEEENLQLLGHRKSFIEGAKWQEERMYSEEDMINFSIWVYLEIGQNTGKARTNKELFQEWLEQNKQGGDK
jgi:hypothetical protein